MTVTEARAAGLEIPKCLEDAETRPRRDDPEHREQVRVAAMLMLCGIPFSASLAGVGLSKAQRGKAKARGVQAGDPDLTIWRTPPAHPDRKGMCVEMKAPDLVPKTDRAGEFSGARPEQRARLEMLRANGWHVVVAYGHIDALTKIQAAGYRLPLMPSLGR